MGIRSVCQSLLVFLGLLMAFAPNTINADTVGSESRKDRSGVSELPLPVLSEKSNLPDYLAYAAMQNAGLEAAFSRWKAALEKIPQDSALPDPRFSYGYYIREVETRVGPQRQRFGLSQTFPWFGKLDLKGNMAAKVADAEKAKYESAKLKLFFKVKKTFYEYAYLAKAVQVARENLNLLKYLEEVARIRYAADLASHHDLVRVQVERARLEDRLKTLLEFRQPLVAQLNSAMNRPVNEPLAWPRQIEPHKGDLDVPKVLAMIAKANPDLTALDSLAAREESRIKLAETDSFPSFTFEVQYIDTGDASNPSVQDNGKDPIIAGVSLNIPIWFEKYDAGVREATQKRGSFLRQKENKEKELNAEASLLIYRFQDAGRKMDLYQNMLIPKAKENINVSMQGYEAGQARFLDLIDSVRTLIELELGYERAAADRSQNLAELEMIVGKEISTQTYAKKGSD